LDVLFRVFYNDFNLYYNPGEKEMNKKTRANIGVIILFIVMTLIAVSTAFFISTMPLLVDCEVMINESFINGTKAGYIAGIQDVSIYVLQTGMLPHFNDYGNLQSINLTEMFNDNNR